MARAIFSMEWKLAFVVPEAAARKPKRAPRSLFSYGLAAQVIAEKFAWVRGKAVAEEQAADESYGVDRGEGTRVRV